MSDPKQIRLHLVLTYHWFDEMVAGRKDVEYRLTLPHWQRLIWDRRDRIATVRFSRAYTSTTITRPVISIDIGPCPLDDWNDSYYRIHMGPITERVFSGNWAGQVYGEYARKVARLGIPITERRGV